MERTKKVKKYLKDIQGRLVSNHTFTIREISKTYSISPNVYKVAIKLGFDVERVVTNDFCDAVIAEDRKYRQSERASVKEKQRKRYNLMSNRIVKLTDENLAYKKMAIEHEQLKIEYNLCMNVKNNFKDTNYSLREGIKRERQSASNYEIKYNIVLRTIDDLKFIINNQKRLIKYYKLNFIKRLFTKKPINENIQDFNL